MGHQDSTLELMSEWKPKMKQTPIVLHLDLMVIYDYWELSPGISQPNNTTLAWGQITSVSEQKASSSQPHQSKPRRVHCYKFGGSFLVLNGCYSCDPSLSCLTCSWLTTIWLIISALTCWGNSHSKWKKKSFQTEGDRGSVTRASPGCAQPIRDDVTK